MGYSVVRIEDIGPSEDEEVAGPDGFTMVAVGAPRGSYEARGPF